MGWGVGWGESGNGKDARGCESRTRRRTLMVAAYELIYLSERQWRTFTLRARQISPAAPRVYLSRGSMDA